MSWSDVIDNAKKKKKPRTPVLYIKSLLNLVANKADLVKCNKCSCVTAVKKKKKRQKNPQDLIKSIHIYWWLSWTQSVSDEDGVGGRSVRAGSCALGEDAAEAPLGEQTEQVAAKTHAHEGVEERVEAAVGEAQALGHRPSSPEEQDGLAAPGDDALQVVHRLQERGHVVGQPADAEDQGDEQGQPDCPLLLLAPGTGTPEQSHRHGAVAVSHDGQRQEEAGVLQHAGAQDPVVSMDLVVAEGAGEDGGVHVLRHAAEHQIGHRYDQADQPEGEADQVHRPLPAMLQAGHGVNDGQVAVHGDARQQEAPDQAIELPGQAHQLAAEVAEEPTDEVLQDAEGEGGQEQQVGGGQVQQVELTDAQETPAAQEDGHHQAVPHHTQQEEAAVKEGFERGLEAPQSAVLVAAVGLVVFRVIIIRLVGFVAMLQKIDTSSTNRTNSMIKCQILPFDCLKFILTDTGVVWSRK